MFSNPPIIFKFVTCLGYTIDGEPHDVPREHWKDCEKFKYYWGLAEHMNDQSTMNAIDAEIYDNIDEHFTICQRCNKRFYRRSSNDKYCDKCKGYHKLKSKTIICEDCGKEFEVSSNVKNKKRCDECQKEHRKNQQKELMRKKRAC